MNLEKQKFLEQNFGRLRKSLLKKVNTSLAVKYTRVSGGKQLLTDSIENQNKAIDDYAKRMEYQVVATFGDTHESAKTDERKEFKRMIDFCRKSKGKISTILVYKMTRFSRSGGKAISMAEELRNKYGIHIIAVSEHVDTTNPNGVVMQDIQLVFAKWDNEQRKEVTSIGMKSKYSKGEWLCKPPQGYSIIKKDKERSIVINEVGKKLQKAWNWKLEGMSNEQIIFRLRKMGVKMYKQQMVKIFKNPFYCGLVAHGMLDGKVVEGKHEAMVSQEVFFEINEMRRSSPRFGIPHKRENDHLALRVFLACDRCGVPMTGYEHKQKHLFYYKCRTNGCGCNLNADTMHDLFMQKIRNYVIRHDITESIVYELEHAYHLKHKDSEQQELDLNRRLSEVKEGIRRIDEKYYIREEMTKEKYETLSRKLEEEKQELSEKVEECALPISNLKEKLRKAVGFCWNISKIWANSGYEQKQRLQKLIFPEGLRYDKFNRSFLTPKVNSVIAEIARLAGDSAIIERGLSVSEYSKSPFAVM